MEFTGGLWHLRNLQNPLGQGDIGLGVAFSPEGLINVLNQILKPGKSTFLQEISMAWSFRLGPFFEPGDRLVTGIVAITYSSVHP